MGWKLETVDDGWSTWLSRDGRGAKEILDDERMSKANESLSRRNVKFYLKVVDYINKKNKKTFKFKRYIYIYIEWQRSRMSRCIRSKKDTRHKTQINMMVSEIRVIINFDLYKFNQFTKIYFCSAITNTTLSEMTMQKEGLKRWHANLLKMYQKKPLHININMYNTRSQRKQE